MAASRPAANRYVRPDWFTAHVFNPAVAWLTTRGISVYGSRVLAVRGRGSGEWRTTPVNLLFIDHERYLVAPRGITQWVRNIRVSGTAELRLGRGREAVRVQELGDDDKPEILRHYVRKWKVEVGVFFQGVDATATDQELRRIAPGYPVFRILPA